MFNNEGRVITLPVKAQVSHSSDARKPRVSGKVQSLIARLGLRCEPSGNFDRQVWAAKLAMLADDVAHIPVDLLETAINQHVAKSPYLPKASDLNELAREAMGPRTTAITGHGFGSTAHVEHLNANVKRQDVEWAADGNGGVYMRYRHGMSPSERSPAP